MLGARQIVSVVISSGASKLEAAFEAAVFEVVVLELIRAGRSFKKLINRQKITRQILFGEKIINQPFPEKAAGSSDLIQSEMFDFELIEFARSSSLLLAVSEMILELECVEEIALSLSEISSIRFCGRGLVEERVALEVVLCVTGTDSSFEIFENFVCDFDFLLPERESDEATEFDLIEF